ncbi:MAG: OmpH family outer membrane protein [Kiloniellaceae bacterium]
MSSLHRHTLRAAAVLLLISPWLFAEAPARAQDAKAPVFAIIDVQRILRESTAVRGLAKRIERRRDQHQAELRKMEQNLRDADRELARQRTVLSADAFAEKRKELQRQVAMLQREAKQRKRSLDQTFAKGMAQVQKELTQVAKAIAEERGLDLILTKATVVIVKPGFEITNDALKRLNARLPEISASVPQN